MFQTPQLVEMFQRSSPEGSEKIWRTFRSFNRDPKNHGSPHNCLVSFPLNPKQPGFCLIVHVATKLFNVETSLMEFNSYHVFFSFQATCKSRLMTSTCNGLLCSLYWLGRAVFSSPSRKSKNGPLDSNKSTCLQLFQKTWTLPIYI